MHATRKSPEVQDGNLDTLAGKSFTLTSTLKVIMVFIFMAGIHITFKEALAVETAAVKWAHKWSNHRVFVYCDNQAAVGILNKGSCRDPFLMQSLRRIFWLSATFNFKIKAIYLPGVENVLADAVSRLHEPRGYERLMTDAGSQAALGHLGVFSAHAQWSYFSGVVGSS